MGHRAWSRWLKAQGARPKVEEFRSEESIAGRL
jgi:hypothetical protein